MIYRFTVDTKLPEIRMRRSRLLLLAAAFALLTACSYKPTFINEYKIDVQQGNVLTQDMVAQLKPGQTREQVRFILGTPLISDIFHRDRWDYVYRFREGRSGKVQSRQFSVFFDANGQLARVAGDVEQASIEELTMPVSKTRVVDLGAMTESAAGEPPPQPEGPGFFRRMMNRVGF
jgi:outer membrane protein assembly factor BamE